MWQSDDNSPEPVLFFYLVDPGDETWFVRLSFKHFYQQGISLAANAFIVSGLGLLVCVNIYLIPTCFDRKLVGILFKMLKIEVYNFVTECTLRSMKRKGTMFLY